MPKTVVFHPLQATGHVHPMLALASEMQRRGYRTILLTVRRTVCSPRIASLQLELEHCVEEDVPDDLDKLSRLASGPNPIDAFAGMFMQGGLVYQHMADLHKHRYVIRDKIHSLRPDLVVVDNFQAPCCYPVLPCAWVGLFPASPLGIYSGYNATDCAAEMGIKPTEMSAEMVELEHKLKGPTRRLVRNFWNDLHNSTPWPGNIDTAPVSPWLNFYLGPRELDYDTEFGAPLPREWFRLEHTIMAKSPGEAANQWSLPEKLERAPGKLVYFSLGTIASSNLDLMNKLVAILAKSPHRFIISMGPKSEQLTLAVNMWGAEFLDQESVLQQVDMFITHGGHNSTIEAFYYGVPALIVMPVFADQFDIARRVEDCRFGAWVNPYTCGERELLDAIATQLANEHVRQRMQAISARLKSIDYPKIAADKLEQLMSNREEIVSNGHGDKAS